MAGIARPPGDEGTILAASCESCDNERRLDSSCDQPRFEHAFVDGTVVNVAPPALQKALRANLADVKSKQMSNASYKAAVDQIGEHGVVI